MYDPSNRAGGGSGASQRGINSKARPTKAATDHEPASAHSLWTTGDLSHYLGVPVGTIYQWRSRGEGPVGYKIGKHIRYDEREVQKWLATRSDGMAA